MVTLYKAKAKASLIGATLTLDIDSTDYEVNGLSRYKQKIVFVSGALQGEKVQALVLEDKAGFIKARTSKVLSPAPGRQRPFCPHFSQCGGCQLQYLDNDQQIRLKQQGIDQLIRHQTGLETLPWQPMIAAADTHYRRKARLGVWFDKKTRQLSVGFRAEGSKHISAISECSMLSPLLTPVLTRLPPAINALPDPAVVTHLELFCANQRPYVVVRHVKPLTAAQQQAFVQSWPEAYFLGDDGTEQLQHWQPDTPTPAYTLTEQDIRLQFQPGDFIQINEAVNQKMVSQALAWLEVNADDTILDLYAGMGNFSLPLAKYAKTVQGIEGVAKMVQQAATNATLNGLSNASFAQADLHLPWPDAPWRGQGYTKVVLDPARAGAKGAIEQIAALKAAQILYVSCNAATFARDARVLLSQGYQLQKLSAIDMFPHTSHLELMALFSASSKSASVKSAPAK
ncbi:MULTISPECIES: 23S rRNA (uracil(1939)-C(5))-methyltransferase RlmD [unclassified Arsukibacterium]|uniref:23S rRNA (uracil(1939)-C(5))-methyltransferase RlmD n=1 Tax=unclassified Arsukibacterium TaxID=2635278 RepID=UPI000C6A4B6B|nr:MULTISPECIES: 23S rRNA (uracil(1939)-C(5))-methyltransferase RlmD [unclassified Arsukibacterium]MAA94970.1 23S rRNA (uracil(1939)-C(5))-methyltransferase RlmD [Rheinheimera sp.]MBM33534.1 23S rRNA (uracil(1939)-C(5))-methyltransferase RlmD [Rheinheimera sp.]HAW92368.1 23S rRNA (uracil(1939)-C(5))-methyltransferase RlmD [Candidatus Azambacteria bacterium]|tara:strand:+ start:256079 stop:257443 length:1365 start_codon:yes stop_codon:yes gene_type:complete